MKSISAFQTSDGEIFDTEEAASRHEFFLENKDLVEDFLGSNENPYKGSAHRSIVQGSILRWELWRARNVK